MSSADFIAVSGFVVLFALMLLRVPIGIAMGLVGVGGFAAITGWKPALNLLAQSPVRTITDFNLSLIPFFILMGVLATNSGMSREMFRAGHAWFGSFRGGMALSTISACAGFAAICDLSGIKPGPNSPAIVTPSPERSGY